MTPIPLVDLSFPCYKGLPLVPPSLQLPDKEEGSRLALLEEEEGKGRLLCPEEATAF